LTADSVEVLELQASDLFMRQAGTVVAYTRTNTQTAREMGLQAFPTPDLFLHYEQFV
jgi:hypothetical protein